MVLARFASPDDADEITRLRAIMLSAWVDTTDNGWMADSAAVLKRRLGEAEPSMVSTVVDAPESPGSLAACATGIIEERLPSPRNRTGRFGWIFNVSTDPAWRRRGYSRACMDALLRWYDERGVLAIELLATESGAGLYGQLGFTVSEEPAMRRHTW
ncbi:GNAT family N-acetyltransferase [Glycomyces buryatensis]|uniref:GNAT family N-acetyltransferase n=1 Tax=Glycomyces buryatensis TaxID=2570927 RepID=A0A4S8QB26_9ACTN|nr:GNAT family N-acetyltransferase [Glycomyces buryatensis]THV40092.1 GNAT family N-acetyltransferase [Glycomyces buryatensis]